MIHLLRFLFPRRWMNGALWPGKAVQLAWLTPGQEIHCTIMRAMHTAGHARWAPMDARGRSWT